MGPTAAPVSSPAEAAAPGRAHAARPVRCPGCALTGSVVIDTVPVPFLASLWRSRLGIALPDTGPAAFDLRHCPGCDLRFFDPLLPGDGRLYARLQRFPWYYLGDKDEYDLAARHVGPDHAVLEVGAARGAFARRIRCARYVGLELSEEAILAARAEGLDVRAEPVESFAAAHGGAFDRVCLFQVLEHVPNPREFLAACASCAGAGGLVIVSVPSEDAFLGDEVNAILNLPPHHLTRWTDRALAAAVAAAGLEPLALVHEPLADRHVANCARARTQAALQRLARRRRRLVDPLLASLWIRVLVAAAALPRERRLRRTRLRPWGHSITAICRKP